MPPDASLMPDQNPPASTDRFDAYAAFRVPLYRDFLLGSLLVQLGTAAQGLALGWEVYQRTGEAFSLGMIGLVQAVPMLLLTLPAGYLADVLDRRKLILVSLAGTVITSLGLAACSYFRAPVGWMYALLFLESAFLRLGWPARAALLPLLVPRHLLENAVKWRTSAFHVSAMVGPALGGFIIAWSLSAAYLFCSICTAVFMLVMLRLRLPHAPRGKSGAMFVQLLEGLRFVWRNKLILGAMSLDLFAVLLGGAVYLLPIYANDILRVGEEGLGYLRAAPAVGAFAMALLLAHLPPMRRAGATLLLCVAGFGIATIVFGFSKSFWLSLAMLFLTGAFDNVSMVVRGTLIQLATPNEMRGRVSAVNGIFIGSSNELGGFESGLVAAWFNPVVSVVSGGAGTLLVVAACWALFPRLGRLRTFSELEDSDIGRATGAHGKRAAE
jgi:MFS family permease